MVWEQDSVSFIALEDGKVSNNRRQHTELRSESPEPGWAEDRWRQERGGREPTGQTMLTS